MHPVLFHIGPVLVPAYGVVSALGVLVALALVLRTARLAGVNPNQVWNLCILALFAAIAGSRLLLVILNWTIVSTHPAWLLGLAMIHHPLLAAAGTFFALVAAIPYARSQHLALRSTADALAAPLALGLGFEQIGALLAGSGYGTPSSFRWAVVYTHPLAARWSGAPLFEPVHPVQAYAAFAFFAIAMVLSLSMPLRRQQGDLAGIWLITMSAAVFLTEFWRDPEGRGSVLQGAFDGPQLAAMFFAFCGAFVLLESKNAHIISNSLSNANEATHD